MRADVGFLPILLFWGAMVLVARAQNARKRQQQQQRPLMPDLTEEPPAPRGLMDELTRAMEELKRAEMQQRNRVEARAQQVSVPPRKRTSSMFAPVVNRPSVPDARSMEAPEDTVDYDDQSVREAETRLAAQQPSPVLRTVAPKPASRPPSPVPGPPTTVPRPPSPVPGPLARFATGTARDAVVLNEILGRPLAERMND